MKRVNTPTTYKWWTVPVVSREVVVQVQICKFKEWEMITGEAEETRI